MPRNISCRHQQSFDLHSGSVLQVGQNVRINLEGECHGGMPKSFAHDLRRDASGQSEGGRRVTLMPLAACWRRSWRRMFGRPEDSSSGLKCRPANVASRIGPPLCDVKTKSPCLAPAALAFSSNLRRRAITQFCSLTMRRLRSRLVSSKRHSRPCHSRVFETLTVSRSRLKSDQVSARYSLGLMPVVTARANKTSYLCPEIAAMKCLACSTSNTVKSRRDCRGRWASSAGFVRRSFQRTPCRNAEERTACV